MNEIKKPAVNPLIVLFLGACPAMGASTSVKGALGMGCAVLVIMLLSALIVAALKKALPEKARMAATLLIVAGVASVVQLLMNALLHGVYNMLGIYIAVAAVNLLIFAGTEEKAGLGLKNCLVAGICFVAAIVVMGAIRELFGAASFWGKEIAFLYDYRILTLTQASGGFFVFAVICAVIAKIYPTVELKAEGFAAQASGLDSAVKEEK